MDPSHGYERVAVKFMAGRGQAKQGIGAATVRAWARTLPSGATVLDLGCGSGIPISQVLIEEGLVVYGVDASPTLAAAFRRHFPHVPIACEAVEGSAFFNRSFDGIIAWGLVFLLSAETQVDLLQRMAAALTPRGRLLFTSPQQACTWTDALTGCLSRSLGREAYARILVAAGLRPIEEYEDEGQNHYYDAVRQGGQNSRATAAA